MNAKLAELRKCTALRSSYSWGSVMRDAESPLVEAVRELRAALDREWSDPAPCSRAQEIWRAQDVRFAREWVLHLMQRDPLFGAPHA
jgi:folate-binding Fe-S cluster repair protein YgfZ